MLDIFKNFAQKIKSKNTFKNCDTIEVEYSLTDSIKETSEIEHYHAFDIEGWYKNTFYFTLDYNIISVSAVSRQRYAYETEEYKKFLNGKKVKYLGKVRCDMWSTDRNQLIIYEREL